MQSSKNYPKFKLMKLIYPFVLLLVLLVTVAANAPQYSVGDIVTDFSLKSTNGKMVSLADYKTAKGVILIFDCNTCPFSRGYNERIIALNAKYESKGFPLITINANDPGISPGDSFEEMVKVAKEKSYDFPYLLDETQQVAKAFGATNTPHVYVLQREGGKFKVAYIGAIDNNAKDKNQVSKKYVEEAVDALLSNKEVPVTKTKAIGCGIKFRNS
jgi:peroxiredoxin